MLCGLPASIVAPSASIACLHSCLLGCSQQVRSRLVFVACVCAVPALLVHGVPLASVTCTDAVCLRCIQWRRAAILTSFVLFLVYLESHAGDASWAFYCFIPLLFPVTCTWASCGLYGVLARCHRHMERRHGTSFLRHYMEGSVAHHAIRDFEVCGGCMRVRFVKG